MKLLPLMAQEDGIKSNTLPFREPEIPGMGKEIDRLADHMQIYQYFIYNSGTGQHIWV